MVSNAIVSNIGQNYPSTSFTLLPNGLDLIDSSWTSKLSVLFGGISFTPLDPYACAKEVFKPIHGRERVTQRVMAQGTHQIWGNNQLPLPANAHPSDPLSTSSPCQKSYFPGHTKQAWLSTLTHQVKTRQSASSLLCTDIKS